MKSRSPILLRLRECRTSEPTRGRTASARSVELPPPIDIGQAAANSNADAGRASGFADSTHHQALSCGLTFATIDERRRWPRFSRSIERMTSCKQLVEHETEA